MDLQQLLTLGVVLAAIGYLARRTWLRLSGRRTGGCGSCSGCAVRADGESPAEGPLVPIETLISSARRDATRSLGDSGLRGGAP
ncbi:MAG: hypothetical protein MUF25_21640 [Pirellulaceae bacterium]|nr:hypothetical protein [Pirellulaceae bacterium]